MKTWYDINNIDVIDSPSIVLYKDRLEYNLNKMIAMVKGHTALLMPHVKTHKMPEVIKLMVDLGIKKFKASTIAEAEIAAKSGAETVLIAHQLVGPKLKRFCALAKHIPETSFFTIIDNSVSLEKLNAAAKQSQLKIGFFIDINSGMNRSGITLGPDLDHMIKEIPKYNALNFKGLHVYDGHLRDKDFEDRQSKIESELKPIKALFNTLKKQNSDINLICGGTPSFTSHLLSEDKMLSPGTCVLWDWGYSEKLIEQEFKYAALLVCRVISKPKEGIVTIDLGHKSVSSENPIHQRVKFLNLDNYQLMSQSEEHGVLKVKNWEHIKVGDVFYGLPYHICPTINLHDEVSVILDNKLIDTWEITGRKRKLSF
ncbi:D-TA family PLP-dependent enzyme [Flavivirga algicola]|uniref:D-TA family PLP-dependent enzyme n=1 Tax=Flavivirga algicola TaxID=2729136 RepID=A0ABX1RZ02_9FLAO|nr:D-TA family PLP-dependent enzyme [Flavivirga algicola]NMH88253.1 D-TA family PLP-dependent enzyme [Flavivirga algicola]